jgi:hypothetical protein
VIGSSRYQSLAGDHRTEVTELMFDLGLIGHSMGDLLPEKFIISTPHPLNRFLDRFSTHAQRRSRFCVDLLAVPGSDVALQSVEQFILPRLVGVEVACFLLWADTSSERHRGAPGMIFGGAGAPWPKGGRGY